MTDNVKSGEDLGSIVLGRAPSSSPAISMTVSKPDGRRIRLVAENQSGDDVSIRGWDIDVAMEPGSAGMMMNVEGMITLTDERLMHPQKCWTREVRPVNVEFTNQVAPPDPGGHLNLQHQVATDVEGVLERGDHVSLRFENPDWIAETEITQIIDRQISVAKRTPHPMREALIINANSEYRAKDEMLDPGNRQELVAVRWGMPSGLVPSTYTIKGWRQGRPGSNLVLNGFNYDSAGISTGVHRQISLWCSEYKNSSTNGIEMRFEMPTRRA